MDKARSLEANLYEFLKMIFELANFGDKEELSDENKVITILSSLPEAYREVKSAIKYGRSSITLDEVTSALKSKDLEIRADNKTSDDGKNHMARVKQQRKNSDGNNFKSKNHGKPSAKINNRSTNSNVDKKCFYCNKMGRLKKDCYSWIKKSKENQASTSQGHQDSANFDDGYNDVKVLMASGKLKVPEWILDSGCNYHMTHNKHWLSNHQELKEGKGMKIGGLYYLIGETLHGVASVATTQDHSKATLWHRRLGHISEKGLQLMSKQNLLEKDKVSKLEFCEHCILVKHQKEKFPRGKHMSTQVLEYIHSDLWGSSRTATHGGNLYFLSIIDDFSRKVWIYLLKHKNQTFQKFKEWKILVENLIEKRVKFLRTGNGLEFCNAEFDKFCANEGIQRHKTVKLTPQQNGVAERMNSLCSSKSMKIGAKSHQVRVPWLSTRYQGLSAVGKESHQDMKYKKGRDMVCLLKKSLYDLKQSPRQWYKRFDTFMFEQVYSKSSYDSCLYFNSSTSKISELKKILSKEFDMKDLGDSKRVLGINIIRDKKNYSLALSQRSYLKRLVDKFAMKNAKPVTQLLASHFSFSASQCQHQQSNPYSSAVGTVMYTMVCSRPDIAHAISVLSRYMSNPGKDQWLAMKHLLRYLKGTTDVGLVYCKRGSSILVESYVDSDYAGDKDNKKSTIAYQFLINGNCVS
ncbi:hypothetical protein AXG93_4188s1020 [Marchantia polymorpha subsp. ruderalis]|uniref:Integrase catalytic domain-containing protein n=1 Tax=Marchantia polymorpha subsp. ruderalis TaxID=1480154 RepID=A0A176WF33_MARPO|nr:hypothetical protein AXG93_4188s1020 [Marchantia polymorpha subsp. ruderalis]